MENESKVYTGSLVFRNVDFSFVFIDDTLQLVPSKEYQNEVYYKWICKEVREGVYTNGDSIRIEDRFLEGRCDGDGRLIIFMPKSNAFVDYETNMGNNSSKLYVPLLAYIICKYDRDSVSRISFSSPEINYIHPTNESYSYSFNPTDNDGIVKIETKDFSSTTTESHSFVVDGQEVSTKFGVYRTVSMNVDKAPISLNSMLLFDFEPTTDWCFLIRLWGIAREYIQYLCYRRDVNFDEIGLSSPFRNGQYERFATLFIVEDKYEPDRESLKKGCYIKQNLISSCESTLLQDIADKKIYLRHLPKSYKDGHSYDAARFIMIVSAFEWEFNRFYPNGVTKTPSREMAEENAKKKLETLISESSGKEKDIFKYLKKRIGDSSLETKVFTVCKELDSILAVFGNRLYAMNNKRLCYSDMGNRLASQRNNFAHGNLDKDFIDESLLDLMFLEYVIYAMQLRNYGVEETYIKNAINDLFHRGFAL
ncbi:MAG: hypothetical protein HUJ58_04830 [Erysipelotrichaceae bacterium]|nr:hypothetical protein [Erysipelotrichaceae bacterium]